MSETVRRRMTLDEFNERQARQAVRRGLAGGRPAAMAPAALAHGPVAPAGPRLAWQDAGA